MEVTEGKGNAEEKASLDEDIGYLYLLVHAITNSDQYFISSYEL